MAVSSQVGEGITVALNIGFYAREVDNPLSESSEHLGPPPSSIKPCGFGT